MFMLNFLKHNYYDHPDGEAPFEKMFALGRYGFTAGIFAAAYDILEVSKVNRYRDMFRIGAFYTLPLTAMGVSFAAVTYTACNLRNKDDLWNYCLGTLASSMVFHKWTKNMERTCLVGMLILGIGVVKKMVVESGYEFHPKTMSRTYIKRREFLERQDVRYMN